MLLIVATVILTNLVNSTVDLNESELIYLSNHLSIEECRKLVAYAHYKTFDVPNALDQAEHKISSDESCLHLLNHWNSAEGEGKGETHEILIHRLQQMDKYELADWLGKTVFKQLGKDLEEGLEKGFKQLLVNLTSTTEEENFSGITYAPPIDDTEPTTWLPIDTVMYVVFIVLLIIFIAMVVRYYKRRQARMQSKIRSSKFEYQKIGEEDTEDEEDKKVVREYSTILNNRNIQQKFEVITI